MMAYEPQPQNEYQETSTEMKFAASVGLAVAAWQVANQMMGMSSMASWDWIILWRSLAIGLFVGGVAYALALIVITIAPGLPALLLKEAEEATGLDLGQPKRDLPVGQPVREQRQQRQQIEIQALPLVDDDTEEFELPELPAYMTRVDKMIWPDRLSINGRIIDMPEGFNTDWLYTVAEKREAGQLETISLRALDDIKISRFGNGTVPAAMVIEVLEETGCIESMGERQPYSWTDSGKKVFPSPTD